MKSPNVNRKEIMQQQQLAPPATQPSREETDEWWWNWSKLLNILESCVVARSSQGKRKGLRSLLPLINASPSLIIVHAFVNPPQLNRLFLGTLREIGLVALTPNKSPKLDNSTPKNQPQSSIIRTPTSTCIGQFFPSIYFYLLPACHRFRRQKYKQINNRTTSVCFHFL